jgi:AhpD family alkylhydroperoxidase
VEDATGDESIASVFGEIRRFYDRADVPAPFRLIARDAVYLRNVWQAVQHAYEDHHLSRRLKEALAFAVSLTSRSRFGTAFHLAESRRLGVTDRGVMEVLGVTQMFSSYTKIADTLGLESDMGTIAPPDPSPPPARRE